MKIHEPLLSFGVGLKNTDCRATTTGAQLSTKLCSFMCFHGMHSVCHRNGVEVWMTVCFVESCPPDERCQVRLGVLFVQSYRVDGSPLEFGLDCNYPLFSKY